VRSGSSCRPSFSHFPDHEVIKGTRVFKISEPFGIHSTALRTGPEGVPFRIVAMSRMGRPAYARGRLEWRARGAIRAMWAARTGKPNSTPAWSAV